jgi:hypothetical protein
LLVVLARRPGRVLSRDQLRDAALGRPAEPYDRSVDVLVGRLRKKIEPDPKSPRFISTRELRLATADQHHLRRRFVPDSPLEGDGFELPVPREKKSRNLTGGSKQQTQLEQARTASVYLLKQDVVKASSFR